MNIEEAKQVIYNMEIDENSISCKNCVLKNRKSCVVNGKDCQMEAIYIVLNELDKNTETINNLINEVTIKDSKLELKDQVIWFMANRLTTEYHDIDWVPNYYYEEAKKYLEKSKTENN